MRVYAKPRPYTLTFSATGTSYPLSSEEAQRLLDEYPATKVLPNVGVQLRCDDGTSSYLCPATLDGGPAFEVQR